MHVPYRIRRSMCASACFCFVVSLAVPAALPAQGANMEILGKWIQWQDAGSMLIRHLSHQAFAMLDRRDRQIQQLRTREDWEERQRTVRATLETVIGPFPKRTPLKPRTTGIVQKPGYRIEKIIFESMPNFYVTGCLFIPDGIDDPRPAILTLSV